MSRWEAAEVGEELGAAAAVGAAGAVACMLWAEAGSHKVPFSTCSNNLYSSW